jgi:hypothetical protein
MVYKKSGAVFSTAFFIQFLRSNSYSEKRRTVTSGYFPFNTSIMLYARPISPSLTFFSK